MNIAITLPKNLIHEIINGEKCFEMRKALPAYYFPRVDYVAVVEKGTKRCPLILKVSDFKYVYTDVISEFVTYYSVKLCVPEEWIMKYIEGRKGVWLWKIGAAHETPNPEKAYRALKLKRNPQSYVYINKKYI